MLGYVTISSNDPKKAGLFYDALFARLGARRLQSFARGMFYGTETREVAILSPSDGEGAGPGKGAMVALEAASRAIIDEVHALALDLGGSDEEAPRLRGRPESAFYGASFRDPESNKLCVYRIGPA